MLPAEILRKVRRIEIRTNRLVNESLAAGPYKNVWDRRNDAGQTVSSGVYFCKLVANTFSQTKKMVLLK